jgi:hypothetical protein
MADMIPQGSMDLGDGTGYEKADANLRAVTVTMIVILSTAAVAVLSLYGMLGFLEKRGDALDAQVPAMYAQRVIPPKPHLLPSPFQETKRPVTLSGMNPQVEPREAYDTTTDDQLPWDKMRQENGIDEAQADGYTYNAKTGGATIPIEEAIAQMSGGSKNEFSLKAPDETKSNLPSYYGGIYTESSRWESPEHKLSADSSGGLKTETK